MLSSIILRTDFHVPNMIHMELNTEIYSLDKGSTLLLVNLKEAYVSPWLMY